MSAREISDQLRALAGEKRVVLLSRIFPSERRLSGFILGVGRELILMHPFHDFYPEGYSVIRARDIMEIRAGEYDQQWDRMLAEESLLENAEAPFDVPLDSVSELLQALKARRENIIVECEDASEDIEDFYIGRILAVNDNAVSFANFDALGRWDAASHSIPIEEITKVQFDTPYVRTFSKYLEGPCPLLDK